MPISDFGSLFMNWQESHILDGTAGYLIHNITCIIFDITLLSKDGAAVRRGSSYPHQKAAELCLERTYNSATQLQVTLVLMW